MLEAEKTRSFSGLGSYMHSCQLAERLTPK